MLMLVANRNLDNEYMSIIYVIVALLLVIFFLNKKYLPFLLCYTALMTNLFMLDAVEGTIKGSDICFCVNIVLLPVALLRRSKERTEDNTINSFVKIFLGFTLFEFLYTIYSGADTGFNAFKVIRIPLMLLAFYSFSIIPMEVYKRYLKIMLWITLLQGVLFLLQFLGINVLVGRYDEELYSFAFALNIPTFIFFYIFYCLDAEYTKKTQYIWFLFFIAILLLTFVRGWILSVILGVVSYVVMIRGFKKSKFFIIALLFVAPIMFSVVETKSTVKDSQHSSISEIRNLFLDRESIIDNAMNGGTLTFRMAMLIERIDYLIQNPKFMLLGVGAIHEDSPNCYNRFDFKLGTSNEDKYYGRCFIDSGDITWVPIVLRYGMIGTLVYLCIPLLLFKLARKRKDMLRIIFPLFVVYFFKSFNGALFEMPVIYLELSIYLSLFVRSKVEKKELHCN